ncbi:hypothetical protein [Streptacidiphilus jiangxiensis]|uniref:Uncharacterized protein n=1 Tax=Streptacidiphilus jiangxiensis TaxID=235985 RepID=A0A1H8BWL7_STRJI|nr:hypothetical protein [Streptacidiphilus jiangxiensis]SEM86257.1 hypothetical protein SAMN05414137_1803 [Streptacidiphilus jiangxiensis]
MNVLSPVAFVVFASALLPTAAVVQGAVARRGQRRAPQAVIGISVAVMVLAVASLAVTVWIVCRWFTGQCSGTSFWTAILAMVAGGWAYTLAPEITWARRAA